MNLQMLIGQLGAWSTGKGPLYQKLARALTEAIRNGTVSPGVRLPSERILAGALTLSRTSVVAAYDALREEGWLESEVTDLVVRQYLDPLVQDGIDVGTLGIDSGVIRHDENLDSEK